MAFNHSETNTGEDALGYFKKATLAFIFSFLILPIILAFWYLAKALNRISQTAPQFILPKRLIGISIKVFAIGIVIILIYILLPLIIIGLTNFAGTPQTQAGLTILATGIGDLVLLADMAVFFIFGIILSASIALSFWELGKYLQNKKMTNATMVLVAAIAAAALLGLIGNILINILICIIIALDFVYLYTSFNDTSFGQGFKPPSVAGAR